MKKTLLGLLLCLTVMALFGGSALAQSHRPNAAATSVPRTIHPMASPDAGLKKIFSNLGAANDAFDATNGYFVMGLTNALFGYSQDIAIPFKPRANATVLGVKLALQYYGYGPNGAVAAIYSDAGGVPGSPLTSRSLKNFEDFGTGCCNLATWKLATGLPVTQGTQYWVVGTTNAKTSTSINTWDFVWDDAPGTFAFQQPGTGWIVLTAANGYPPSAVAVYGSVP